MKKKYISPFKPKKYINFQPQYFKIYTFKAGFKKYNTDLLIIIFDKPVIVSGVYSNSSIPSAPIIWDKAIDNNFTLKFKIVATKN